jgi:predicted ATPase
MEGARPGSREELMVGKRRPSRTPISSGATGYLRSVALVEERTGANEEFPWSVPAIRSLGTLRFDPKVTFLVGENGSGKSTLLEAIADVAGFPEQGGGKQFRTADGRSWSSLATSLKLIREPLRERDGVFLRAESFFNVASAIEEMARGPYGTLEPYGGISPHERSHGEAFLMLMQTRFVGNGLYILDEPEAAVSAMRQLAFLAVMRDLVEDRASQFIIASHSPILMSYPGALIYLLGEHGIQKIDYEETEHFQTTRDFLNNRELYFRHLFAKS